MKSIPHGAGKVKKEGPGRHTGGREVFLVEKEKRCYYMSVNAIVISTESIKTRPQVPVISEARRGEDARRDNGGDADSRRALPSLLGAFDRVAISSHKKTVQPADDRIVAYVPATVILKPVTTEKRTSSEMAVNHTAAATGSEIARDGRAAGPYDLNVQTMAMKRYGEANSYRNWHPTPFEIVI